MSSALQCLQRNLVEWQRIQDAPVRAARKSIALSPSLRLAAENADVERRIRDQASRALSKLHLSHAKHAASRMLRLTRGANRWVRAAAAAATAVSKTEKPAATSTTAAAADAGSREIPLRRRSLVHDYRRLSTAADSSSRGGGGEVQNVATSTSASRRLSRAADARSRQRSNSGISISTPRMRRNLTPVRPSPHAQQRFSLARSRSSNVKTRLEAFPSSYSDGDDDDDDVNE